MLHVREYTDTAGRSPFEKSLHAPNVPAAVKVAAALERIAAGNPSNVKTVGGGVLEYRIDFGLATASTSDVMETGLLFCWPAARRTINSETSGKQRRNWEDYCNRKAEK